MAGHDRARAMLRAGRDSRETLAPWAPDPVAPEDVHPPSDQRSPEHRLMIAVLEDALHLLQRPDPKRRRGVSCVTDQVRLTRECILARQEALRWIASSDERWPYSFVNVCGHLKVDADWIRGQVARLPVPGAGVGRGRAVVRSALTDHVNGRGRGAPLRTLGESKGSPWTILNRGLR